MEILEKRERERERIRISAVFNDHFFRDICGHDMTEGKKKKWERNKERKKEDKRKN